MIARWDRTRIRNARYMAQTPEGRAALGRMLEGHQSALRCLSNLLELGAATPDNVAEVENVRHNLTVIESALSEVRA